MLLTARPYAYADPKWHLAGFAELALAPFDTDQVAHFVRHWYRAVRPLMGWDAPTASRKGGALLHAIEERDYLGDLASRPLLLTLMATLHTSWGQLPEDRADLYEESVKLLISRWQTQREAMGPDGEPLREPGIALALGLGEKTLRQALDRLAFDTHECQAELPDRDESPADVSRGQVIGVFESLCPQDLNPSVLLEYLETRAGLLIARREGVYAFPHRSFQEYLAACHLANTVADFGADMRARIWEDPAWWREVYLLGVGKKRQGGLGDAVNLINVLVAASPEHTENVGERHWQAAVLAAKALLELKFPESASGQPHYEAVLRRVRHWLAVLIEDGRLAPKDRLEAGGYDDEHWWTPEGWAWRQGAAPDVSAIKDEDLRKRYDHWLGRRPKERRDRPFWWDESPWNGANRPVVGVSWYEVMAYCAWLEARFRDDQPNVGVLLPSEAQWEKAARGTSARRWSWGDDWREDHANTSEAGLETTSPVGLFPSGVSPCGALDMTGNVWEWTLSKWGRTDVYKPDFPYPYDPTDGRESLEGADFRVVRGGSWNFDQRLARCAYRVRSRPDFFLNNRGFRVVLSLADSGF